MLGGNNTFFMDAMMAGMESSSLICANCKIMFRTSQSERLVEVEPHPHLGLLPISILDKLLSFWVASMNIIIRSLHPWHNPLAYTEM
jgi:hypothetical protein